MGERADLVVAWLEVEHDSRIAVANRLAEGAVPLSGAWVCVDPTLGVSLPCQLSHSRRKRVKLLSHERLRVLVRPRIARIHQRREQVVEGEFRKPQQLRLR